MGIYEEFMEEQSNINFPLPIDLLNYLCRNINAEKFMSEFEESRKQDEQIAELRNKHFDAIVAKKNGKNSIFKDLKGI